eukprot:3440757-Pleurochrysis_carterae.AAC.1
MRRSEATTAAVCRRRRNSSAFVPSLLVSICSCVVCCSVAFLNGSDGGMVSSSFASMLSFTIGSGAACGASYGAGGVAGGAG